MAYGRANEAATSTKTQENAKKPTQGSDLPTATTRAAPHVSTVDVQRLEAAQQRVLCELRCMRMAAEYTQTCVKPRR